MGKEQAVMILVHRKLTILCESGHNSSSSPMCILHTWSGSGSDEGNEKKKTKKSMGWG